MKILFINKYFYLNGGSETVFFQEKNFFSKKCEAVMDFSMADEKNFPSDFSDFFVPNINYKKKAGVLSTINHAISFVHSTLAIKKIDKLISKEKPDIAHLHNVYHQLTPSIIPFLKKNGIKIVLTLHDSKLVCPSYLSLKNGTFCNACKGKYFWRPFTSNCQNSYTKGFLLSVEALFHKYKNSYEAVDLFLAPSKFMAEQITQRIPLEKIQVLHNGIDFEKYHPSYNRNPFKSAQQFNRSKPLKDCRHGSHGKRTLH